MSNITLTVEATPGASIKHTAQEAVALAERIGVSVEFKFNVVTCFARPGDDPDGLVAGYFHALHNENDKYKFASDRT